MAEQGLLPHHSARAVWEQQPQQPCLHISCCWPLTLGSNGADAGQDEGMEGL